MKSTTHSSFAATAPISIHPLAAHNSRDATGPLGTLRPPVLMLPQQRRAQGVRLVIVGPYVDGTE